MKWMAATALIALTSCNFYQEKALPLERSQLSSKGISFERVMQEVLIPGKCLDCHGFGTYKAVISKLDKIRLKTLVEMSMPPEGPLAEDKRELLASWIASGAPEFVENSNPDAHESVPTPTASPAPSTSATPIASSSPTPAPTHTAPVAPEPTPNPTLEPIVTFDRLVSDVFLPKCLRCHGPGGRAEDVPVDDRAYLLDPANGMVVPGNPEASGLFIAVTRNDRRRMPPGNGNALPAQEVELIRQWIAQGAKN